MDCNMFSELIYSYLDNELPTNKADKFKEHLEKCSSCNTLFNQYKKTLELVTDLRSDSPDFVSGAMDKINSINSKKRSHRIRKIVVASSAIAAAAIVTISFGSMFLKGASSSEAISINNASAPYYESSSSCADNYVASGETPQNNPTYTDNYDVSCEFALNSDNYTALKKALSDDEFISQYTYFYSDCMIIYISEENVDSAGSLLSNYIPSIDLNIEQYIRITLKS